MTLQWVGQHGSQKDSKDSRRDPVQKGLNNSQQSTILACRGGFWRLPKERAQESVTLVARFGFGVGCLPQLSALLEH